MSTEFTDEDMANLGRALMKAIETHVPGGWHPAECPCEIVGKLKAVGLHIFVVAHDECQQVTSSE